LTKCKEADTLTRGEFRWLDANLRKTPWNLENVLREMLTTLPLDLEPELANCELVRAVIADPNENVETTEQALRYVRNHLSHGTKTFDPYQLHDAAGILQRAVRGHLLRLLNASEAAQRRAVAKPT
jgi:hypothetical protein